MSDDEKKKKKERSFWEELLYYMAQEFARVAIEYVFDEWLGWRTN